MTDEAEATVAWARRRSGAVAFSALMPRPIVLGVVGDSGAGKTTLTRGLVRVLGDGNVAHLSADDYHRYDRHERHSLGITPLNPDANHLDILTQHLGHLRDGEPILKPVYNHRTGRLGPPRYLRPAPYLVVEGLLGFHTESLRGHHDVRVFLAPPEDLRRAWKLKRDCTRRGYTTDQVLWELDHRERDAESFIRPQREHADIVVCFSPAPRGDPAHLDASLVLRDTLPHPDLAPLVDDADDGPRLKPGEGELLLRIPGDIDPDHAAVLEEAVWERMSFASHLRVRRLGEFTVGTDLLRSESLALVQVILLYHLVSARAALAVGGRHRRSETSRATGADSALHAELPGRP
jgi:phosphoribulokinase